MHYQTYTPGNGLETLVKCYWTLEGTEPADSQRILPDACMELIFHYGDRYRQYLPDGSSLLQPRCFIYGQITTTLDIAPSGSTGIFALRFYPAGLAPFIRIPARQLEDKATALEEIFGAEGTALAQQVLQATDTAERIRICEAFLLQRLAAPGSADQLVQSFLDTIWQLRGQARLQHVSQQLDISRRQLERRCAAATGLSPKQLSKIARLQHTLQLLQDKRSSSLTAIAYEQDYYDQAHFIRDFREFTGMSPGKLLGSNLQLSALFLEKE